MDVGNSEVKSVIYSSKTYSKHISVGHFITTCLVIFSDQKDVNRRNWELPKQIFAFYFWKAKHCLGGKHSYVLLGPREVTFSLRYLKEYHSMPKCSLKV